MTRRSPRSRAARARVARTVSRAVPASCASFLAILTPRKPRPNSASVVPNTRAVPSSIMSFPKSGIWEITTFPSRRTKFRLRAVRRTRNRPSKRGSAGRRFVPRRRSTRSCTSSASRSARACTVRRAFGSLSFLDASAASSTIPRAISSPGSGRPKNRFITRSPAIVRT